MDTNTVLRIVDSVQSTLHPWMTEEGALVRFVSHSPGPRDLTYYDVATLDGSHASGGWLSGRFEVVEPQPITGPLPAGTLLRCVNNEAQARLTDGAFYRVASNDRSPGNGEFLSVYTLDGQGIVLDDDGQLLYQFMSSRFVYYPDSAPAEPTTEKGTTMPNTTALDRSTAATLPIGARVTFTDGGERQGKTFILDRPGVDSDGDFHGNFEGSDYGLFQNWSYFSLPDTLGTPEPTPTEGTATELQSLRVERDAYQRDLERVIDALRQEAIDREWCSEYDRFMERLGFEARCTRKFTVRRRATIEWDEEIEANSEDDAREQADNNNPSYARDIDSDYLDLEDIEIVDVEEA